jgi:hypothetical protein
MRRRKELFAEAVGAKQVLFSTNGEGAIDPTLQKLRVVAT